MSRKNKPASPKKTLSELSTGDKLTFIGLIVTVVGVVVAAYFGYLAVRPQNPTLEQPTLENEMASELTVKWISREEIEVAWNNLSQSPNQYLMITDERWYYNPRRIWESAGKETIAVGEGITRVVIVVVADGVLVDDLIDPVELGDPRISRIITQAPIPEQ